MEFILILKNYIIHVFVNKQELYQKLDVFNVIIDCILKNWDIFVNIFYIFGN